MISRVRWASFAVLAMLAAASPCLAAATDSTGAGPGRGGVGGPIGGSIMVLEEEYSEGALPRFDFSGQWRYAFSNSWRVQFSPGFTWSAYAKEEPIPFTDPRYPADVTKERMLTLLVPVSAQLQWTKHSGSWIYHLGAGPGVYRVWVQNRRKVLKDPITFKEHRGLYLGGTGQIGAERFFKALPSTSLEFALAMHYVVAKRDDQFPSGFNSALGNASLRVGTNYYFSMNRNPKPAETALPGGGH